MPAKGHLPGRAFVGHNGRVVVDDLEVHVLRDGFKGRPSPPSAVPRHLVKLVEVRAATRFRNGWLRLTYPGQPDKPRFEYQDRDLVIFTWQQRESFAELASLLQGESDDDSFTSR